MPIDYNCDPCTDKACENLMLTDDKLYKRFLIRILCAIKSLLTGGGGFGANVVVTGSVLPTGAATEATLASIDGKITACNTGAVVISSSVLPTGAATSANQITGNASLTSIDGKITACNTGAIAGTVTANAGTNLNTSTLALEAGGNLATIAGDTTSIDGKITACNTGAVVVASGSITVDNAAAGSAVNIQDGGNSITVDGSVTVSSIPAVTGTVTANIQGYNGTNNHPIRIDTATRTLQTIDYEHHEIHAGSSFTCHYSNTCTNTNEMTMIAFNTSDTAKWLHLVFNASSTAGAYIAIYEGASLDNDEGADLTVYNRDRNSATASTVSSVETVPEVGKATSYDETQAAGAGLDTTNEIFKWYLGAATAGADLSGQTRAESEFILKQNTQYAFVVVSTSSDDNIHNISLSWYEHTNQVV